MQILLKSLLRSFRDRFDGFKTERDDELCKCKCPHPYVDFYFAPSRLRSRGRGTFGSLREFTCWCRHCRPRCADNIDNIDDIYKIDKRDKADSEVNDRFGFLCNLTEMEVTEPREMRQVTDKLVKHYSSALGESLWN